MVGIGLEQSRRALLENAQQYVRKMPSSSPREDGGLARHCYSHPGRVQRIHVSNGHAGVGTVPAIAGSACNCPAAQPRSDLSSGDLSARHPGAWHA